MAFALNPDVLYNHHFTDYYIDDMEPQLILSLHPLNNYYAKKE